MNINPFIELIAALLNLYGWVLLVSIVINWLTAFDVINRFNPFVQKLTNVLYRLTEPVLRPIRQYMPDLGGIDLSPILVFLLIRFVNGMMYTYLYTYR